MKLKALNNWVEIPDELYLQYGIIESDFMKCENAFIKTYKEQNIVITLYNYGTLKENAFEDIEQELLKNESENRLIDGNPNSPDYEDTSIFSCIFKERLMIKNYECLSVVSKILLPEGYHSFVFQLYAKSNGNLYSVQFKFAEFDEKNIEKAFSEDETFSELLESIY